MSYKSNSSFFYSDYVRTHNHNSYAIECTDAAISLMQTSRVASDPLDIIFNSQQSLLDELIKNTLILDHYMNSLMQVKDAEPRCAQYPIVQKGIIAKEMIRKHKILGIYTGKYMTSEEYSKHKDHNLIQIYTVEISKNLIINGTNGNLFSIINDCPRKEDLKPLHKAGSISDPVNVDSFFYTYSKSNDKKVYVVYYSLKDIPVGTELISDYSENYWKVLKRSLTDQKRQPYQPPLQLVPNSAQEQMIDEVLSQLLPLPPDGFAPALVQQTYGRAGKPASLFREGPGALTRRAEPPTHNSKRKPPTYSEEQLARNLINKLFPQAQIGQAEVFGINACLIDSIFQLLLPAHKDYRTRKHVCTTIKQSLLINNKIPYLEDFLSVTEHSKEILQALSQDYPQEANQVKKIVALKRMSSGSIEIEVEELTTILPSPQNKTLFLLQINNDHFVPINMGLHAEVWEQTLRAQHVQHLS